MTVGERSLGPDAAVELAALEIRRLGLESTVHAEGSFSWPVLVTDLYAASTLCATGSGKGYGALARASSDFEALERFYTVFRCNTRYRDEPRILRAHEVAGQKSVRSDRVVQNWAVDFPNHGAACSSYGGAAGEILYPLFLNDPRYFSNPVAGDVPDAYRSMLRYTSSIGTAAGADEVDARLHGLCELIEHDALSHALLRWFVLHDVRVDVVVIEALPPRLRVLHERAEAELGRRILLVDVTTDLDVPCCLAVGESPAGEASVVGAGASPSGAEAVERALHEVVQSAAADVGLMAHNLERLAPWPSLRDCAEVSVSRLLAGDVREVVVRVDPPGIDDPYGRLRWLDARLDRHSIDTFSRELTPDDSLISVVATYAPALDRFSLVRHGMPVVPTGRAWTLWQRAREAAVGRT